MGRDIIFSNCKRLQKCAKGRTYMRINLTKEKFESLTLSEYREDFVHYFLRLLRK